MKTGPKPFKISEYSFLDRTYTFDEIKQIAKSKLTTRAKISYKCNECGKIETISLDRFLQYSNVLCRTCNIKTHLDYAALIKQRTLKQRESIKEKYGVNNSWQCPNSSEKRNKATNTAESKKKKSETFKKHTREFKELQKQKTEETIITKYGSLKNFYEERYKNYSKTCLEKYGVSNYRILCRAKHIIFDSISFDSKWELAFYLYHKNNNDTIVREPVKLEFVHDGTTHFCFPDFSVNGQLYEIKGDYFFTENGMINPYDRSQDELYNAKYNCMIANNVKFVKYEEIKDMLNYLPKEYL